MKEKLNSHRWKFKIAQYPRRMKNVITNGFVLIDMKLKWSLLYQVLIFMHKTWDFCRDMLFSEVFKSIHKIFPCNMLSKKIKQEAYLKFGISLIFLSSKVALRRLDCMGSCGASTRYQQIFLSTYIITIEIKAHLKPLQQSNLRRVK